MKTNHFASATYCFSVEFQYSVPCLDWVVKYGGLKDLNNNLEEKVSLRTRQIEEHRNLLRAILNTAEDAIITINHKGTMEYIKPATESMFDYTEQELTGQNISILMPSPHLTSPHTDEHDHYLSRYIETNEAHIMGASRELVAKRKDGSHIPISLLITRVDNSPLFTGIIRNVTDLVNLEKEVLRCIEDERNRISRDLHDSVGQSIVGLSMEARSISNNGENEGNKP